jgi:RNA exonuclease 4
VILTLSTLSGQEAILHKIMPTFFTKKQKAQMRERRKKKQRAGGSEKGETTDVSSGVKRKLNEQDEVSVQTTPVNSGPIVVPSHLSGQEARKFRKDERRKARAKGFDENGLVFVEEAAERGQQQEEEEKEPPRKKKKTYPRINDLLQQQKEEALKQQELDEMKKEEERVPPHIRAKYVALDCEMVGIGSNGKQSALARVSLTDWHGEVVMDTFVQVPSRVTDFRTFVSGVTPKDISSRAAMNVQECRQQVSDVLKDKVLVGHALKNDLHALLLTHPKHNIRDTAKYRPFQRVRNGKWRPRKLRDLVQEHLGKSIQVSGESHDSTEDARSTMELFKRVRIAWESELETKLKKKQK